MYLYRRLNYLSAFIIVEMSASGSSTPSLSSFYYVLFDRFLLSFHCISTSKLSFFRILSGCRRSVLLLSVILLSSLDFLNFFFLNVDVALRQIRPMSHGRFLSSISVENNSVTSIAVTVFFLLS